jgi:hypothetical protein
MQLLWHAAAVIIALHSDLQALRLSATKHRSSRRLSNSSRAVVSNMGLHVWNVGCMVGMLGALAALQTHSSILFHLQEQQEAEHEFLGCFKSVIVGIRYYAGRVGVNEVGNCSSNIGLSFYYKCPVC